MLDEAMQEVAADGNELFDYDFVMNAFNDAKDQVEPFKKHLTFDASRPPVSRLKPAGPAQ